MDNSTLDCIAETCERVDFESTAELCALVDIFANRPADESVYGLFRFSMFTFMETLPLLGTSHLAEYMEEFENSTVLQVEAMVRWCTKRCFPNGQALLGAAFNINNPHNLSVVVDSSEFTQLKTATKNYRKRLHERKREILDEIIENNYVTGGPDEDGD